MFVLFEVGLWWEGPQKKGGGFAHTTLAHWLLNICSKEKDFPSFALLTWATEALAAKNEVHAKENFQSLVVMMMVKNNMDTDIPF